MKAVLPIFSNKFHIIYHMTNIYNSLNIQWIICNNLLLIKRQKIRNITDLIDTFKIQLNIRFLSFIKIYFSS